MEKIIANIRSFVFYFIHEQKLEIRYTKQGQIVQWPTSSCRVFWMVGSTSITEFMERRIHCR